jgi:hypothetical protein
MNNTVEGFTKLQQLLVSGAISEEEFSEAIKGVLDRSGTINPDAASETDWQFGELQLQDRISQIDQDWQKEQEQYKVSYGKYAPRTTPNKSGTIMSLFGGLVMAGFGIYWMLQASKATIGGIFPMLGLVVIASGIGLPIYHFTKYTVYKSAHDSYQRRRAEILAEFRRTNR